MTDRWDIIGEAGLQFFGKMSASISHEIKNVLAIINESAGLLEDLTALAEKGMPMDPERLKTHAGKIASQVRRADEIIKNMNLFAHSVDEPAKRIDLGQTVVLMGALSERLATMRSIRLELQVPKERVIVHTNPFFLNNLIWLCVDFAMNTVGASKTLTLIAEQGKGAGRVRLKGLEDLTERSKDQFPGEKENAILAALKGELTLDGEAGEIAITFSGEVPE